MVNRKYLFWIIAACVIALDQITKAIVRATIATSGPVTLIPKVLSFTYVLNTGAGFGLLQGQNILLMLVALIAIIAIILSLRKILENQHHVVGAALILGGAAGNLIDRVLYKAVTDFITLPLWPSFNIADSALTIGVLILLWQSFREQEK
ncbi:MAG: signal peptidase II [Nanoarchaeota archaeon]